MASAQKYMQLLNNPNARRMLDLIASAEGVSHGYNTLFGNQRFDDLSGHPNIRKSFTQTDGKKNYTTAAGRYQFLNDTWNGLSRQYGLRDFSPQSQDLGAIALLDQIGALPYVLKGDFGTAIKKSGGTWASLPSSNYAQNKRSWDFINKQLGSKTKSFEPEFVDLKKVGITPNFKPQMVDLASVGIGAKSEFQPDFVDLNSVGIGG